MSDFYNSNDYKRYIVQETSQPKPIIVYGKRKCSICPIFLLIPLCLLGLAIYIIIRDNKGSQSIIEDNNKEKEKEKEGEKEIKEICDYGFFIPDGEKEIKENCLQCTIENCEKCNGTTTSNICLSCGSKYFPKYVNSYISFCEPLCQVGLDNECMVCDNTINKCIKCNPCFILSEEEKCLPNYSFEALYYTNNNNIKVKLMNYDYLKYIKEMSINNQIVSPKEYHAFTSQGTHSVRVIIDISEINSTSYMFYNSEHLISINFTSKFNTKSIENMDSMFRNCGSLKYIDFSFFNTEKTKIFDGMFYGCSSLKSFSFSYINTTNAESMKSMLKDVQS